MSGGEKYAREARIVKNILILLMVAFSVMSIFVMGIWTGRQEGREMFRTDMSEYLKKHYDVCWNAAGQDQEKARDCLVQFQLGFAMLTAKELDGK